jgi:thiol-disulfide isomerase/thioredoxin
MKKNLKIIYMILTAVFVLATLLLVDRNLRAKKNDTASSDRTEADGQLLPEDVTLERVDNQKTIELKSFKGKVLLINFWATWCEACMVEMPSIQKLQDKFKDKGFEVIGINVDDNPSKVVPAVISKLKLSFTILKEPKNNQRLSEFFGVSAIPYSVVVDKDFKIVWAESGERDWSANDVVQDIEKLLKN